MSGQDSSITLKHMKSVRCFIIFRCIEHQQESGSVNSVEKTDIQHGRVSVCCACRCIMGFCRKRLKWLQTGDVITEMDGEEITSVDAYETKVLSLKPGDSIEIAVKRQGMEEYSRVECTVTAGKLE